MGVNSEIQKLEAEAHRAEWAGRLMAVAIDRGMDPVSAAALTIEAVDALEAAYVARFA